MGRLPKLGPGKVDQPSGFDDGHFGATLWQMKALFDWLSDKTPAIYTKDADRQCLSVGAIGFLRAGTSVEQPMCQPDQKVGTPGQKIA
jgi:hypothetical protein